MVYCFLSPLLLVLFLVNMIVGWSSSFVVLIGVVVVLWFVFLPSWQIGEGTTEATCPQVEGKNKMYPLFCGVDDLL